MDQAPYRYEVVLQIGDTVALKDDRKVPAASVPEGRENHKTARIKAFLDGGGVYLDRDLNGMRYWNARDIYAMENK